LKREVHLKNEDLKEGDLIEIKDTFEESRLALFVRWVPGADVVHDVGDLARSLVVKRRTHRYAMPWGPPLEIPASDILRKVASL